MRLFIKFKIHVRGFFLIVVSLVSQAIVFGQTGQSISLNNEVLYGQEVLPIGVRSKLVDNNNGCTIHFLEAGYETEGRPLIVLLHGFPELAFSWRKQLIPLAEAGYHVIAPDLRGYGRSCGTGVAFEDDLKPYTAMNNVADIIGLVYALGYKEVAAVVGHDYGSAIAANAALYRPDIFKSLILLSVPYSGTPRLPFNTVKKPIGKATMPNLPEALAQLSPPRKHYWWYYSTPTANEEILNQKQGLSDFFRAYFHFKSADYKENKPFAITSWKPNELAKLPKGYIMDLDKNMVETVLPYMPTKQKIADNKWLTDAELNVYSNEYEKTGFQGGAQAYRLITDPTYSYGLKFFTDKTIDVPTLFIAGKSDWGPYLTPGAIDDMETACTKLKGKIFIDNAGHMIQQENPKEVNRLMLKFLNENK